MIISSFLYPYHLSLSLFIADQKQQNVGIFVNAPVMPRGKYT